MLAPTSSAETLHTTKVALSYGIRSITASSDVNRRSSFFDSRLPNNGRPEPFPGSILSGAVRYLAADDGCGHGDGFDLVRGYLVWIGFEDHDVS